MKKKLTHEQTLEWIQQHKAWRKAKKTKPIWARPVVPEDLNTEFQTADRAKQKARLGFWLCVGTIEERWFQEPEKVKGKYEPGEEEVKQFTFDKQSHRYRIYQPKEDAWVWAAQIKGPGIGALDEFQIQVTYAPEPLESKAGGYVVTTGVSNPYEDKLTDVWLVQESLFKSTYE